MAQKTGESTGLKPAEGKKAGKPKFHKPKTEGVKLSSEKQTLLDNALFDIINNMDDNVKEVKRLLKAGANINSMNENNFSPLLVAIKHGEIGIVKLLIEKGVDVNAKTPYGPALLYAQTFENEMTIMKEIIRLLKKAGAKRE